jgi:hypothetical protein
MMMMMMMMMMVVVIKWVFINVLGQQHKCQLIE